MILRQSSGVRIECQTASRRPAFLPDLGNGRAGSVSDRSPSDPVAPGADLGLEAVIRQRLGPDTQDLYADTHRQVDRVLLPLVLEYTGGNQH